MAHGSTAFPLRPFLREALAPAAQQLRHAGGGLRVAPASEAPANLIGIRENWMELFRYVGEWLVQAAAESGQSLNCVLSVQEVEDCPSESSPSSSVSPQEGTSRKGHIHFNLSGLSPGLANSFQPPAVNGEPILLKWRWQPTDNSLLLCTQCQAPSSLQEQQGASTRDAAPLQSIRILVAEDNPINQQVLRQYLQRWGADFQFVADGQHVLHLLEAPTPFRPNLLLLDIQMPVMDGYEVARQIRKHTDQDLAKLPIIAVTASALAETEEAVFAAGMNAYVTKPLRADDFLQCLKRTLAECQQ